MFEDFELRKLGLYRNLKTNEKWICWIFEEKGEMMILTIHEKLRESGLIWVAHWQEQFIKIK